jgi:Tannase and feruloyl esterase
MKRHGFFILVVGLILGADESAAPNSQGAAAARPSACDSAIASRIRIENVGVTAAARQAPGSFTAPGSRTPLTGLTGFCRVQARVTTSNDSLVNFEVWIPDAWNGKLVVTGNGGYSNVPSYRDMAYALSQGYAAVGGDTGHQTPTPDDLQWGAGHRERIVDWGTRSIHAITAPAQRIVTALTGSAPRRAYYDGCSTGGHQAYAEIQNYPQDFDGVIAGAPGNNRVRLNAAYLWQFLSNHSDDGREILTAAKLPMITKAVVAACDKNDGVADGVVDDPRSCQFDPASLTCRDQDSSECLTKPQVAALAKMYAGATNPRSGERIYPGWPKSSEALTTAADGRPGSGWNQYWGTSDPMRVNFWRLWVFNNPQWDPRTFDFDRDIALADGQVGKLVDQKNTDLSAFKAHGAVAVVYQGWQDPVVNAIDTIAYYERVRTQQGSQEETDRFFRLFMVPGMGHCGGGTGTTTFGNQGGQSPTIDADHDLLSALDRWVEERRAPERIIASRVEGGRVTRTRPLCAYPKRAVYLGTGSTDDAANFVCR